MSRISDDQEAPSSVHHGDREAAGASEPAALGEQAQVSGRIGIRVRSIRGDRGLSLERLAALSGVSRSMISVIERGQSSPTAAVLERLAAGLDVPLAALFDQPDASSGPVARHHEQQRWADPATGYRRRSVSPVGTGSPIRIVDVELPAGATVAYDDIARARPVEHQVWVRSGTVEVTVGAGRHRLSPGDCLAYALVGPSAFHNPGTRPARYVVVTLARRDTAR